MKKLYFKEKFFKITDHYPILDEDGREAYYLDQVFTFIGYKSSVSDPNGKKIINISRELIAFFPKYTIDFADGSQMVIQQKFEFFRHKVHVYMDNETLELKGDIFHYDFDIKNSSDKNIGTVNRKIFTLTDTYELAIFDENYTEELIALVICLNNMIDRERANSSASNG
ncbi:LURP-one-related/scramblase family protein [Anaerococcus sp.]|uniref:LURP-one-related/scramblase family protein n=1 Tax=Anaerococcus sp. TaxID=1872515 RepID=UPI0028FE8D23|nr:LURP-one-related family protein [Anaerococcus sp.]MDU1828731.1 LURP-one-related family protein [Anaerococcus sp.]MDU1865298.1 LURP-one-related family protein [Anaerococcus sp.]